MTRRAQKIAVFDIDGTLVRGSIGADFVKALAKEGLFPIAELDTIRQAVSDEEHGRISYEERGRIIIRAWARGLTGSDAKKIREAARRFVRTHTKIHSDATATVRFLKKRGYRTVAISRAFTEILEALNHTVRIDDLIGTEFEKKRDIFTGKLLNQMWRPRIKGRIVRAYAKEHGIALHDSIAFGNSVHDIPVLEVVEHPVCVHPTDDLARKARKTGWLAFDDLGAAYASLSSGSIISLQTSWFDHYKGKYASIELDREGFEWNLVTDKPYVALVRKYVPEGSEVLEAGCGLARTAISLSHAGYQVTAIDNDPKILRIARMNAKRFGKEMAIKSANFFELAHHFKKNRFKAITHQGVLEHFAPATIKRLLKLQLRYALVVIFSVPIRSAHNDHYFANDTIGHRNLWTVAQWKDFLKDFNVAETKRVRQRTDNLLVVLQQRAS